MSGFPWSVLGIEQTREKSAIRKAYSVKLKGMNLDEQVQEYEELRRARDHALMLAAQPPAPPPGSAGSVYDGGHGDYDEDDFFDDFDVRDGAEFDWEIGPSDFVDNPVSGSLGDAGLSGSELGLASDDSTAQRPDGWDELHTILFPDSQHSDEGMSAEEYQQAEDALERLISWAEAGDIARHSNVDYNLAEMLAGAWPRSAPLVERANMAFHWLGEKGGLDERYALQFLNARTEGMRFHEEVLEDSHPLHKAWVELSRPGKASMIDRLRIKRGEIDQLLLKIRMGFPELESLLDSDRIDSWESPSNDTVSWVIQRIFIVFIFVQALRYCASTDDRLQPPVPDDAPQEQRIDGLNAAAATAFGEGIDFAKVEEADPNFARDFEERMGPVQGYALYGDPRQLVRQRILTARKSVDFDTLVEIQALQLEWLREALQESPESCSAVLGGGFNGGYPSVTQTLLDREQALARQLLEARRLRVELEGGEYSYQVPGWLIDSARLSVGLSEEAFVEVLQNPSSEDRCRVQIALIEHVLTAPARVPIVTLRGL